MSERMHRIFVCTTCRHSGTSCLPGYRLLQQLQDAMTSAAPFVGGDFEFSGTAALAGCSRSCTAAFRASAKTIYLFGDVDPAADIDALVASAEKHETPERGLRGGAAGIERPDRASAERSPSVIVSRFGRTRLS